MITIFFFFYELQKKVIKKGVKPALSAAVVWLGLKGSWKVQKGGKKVAMAPAGKTKFCFQMAACHHRQNKWTDRICRSVQDVYFNILVTDSRNIYMFYTKIIHFRKQVLEFVTGITCFAIFPVLLDFYLCSDSFSGLKEKKIVNHRSHLCGEFF